jgi:molecular chaperone DnaJ
MKDYYGILGVDKKASADEIKKAYRKLARDHHPDVSDKPDAEEKFKEINEAYEVLKDPEKRQEYDNPNPFSSTGFGPFGFNPFDNMGGFGFRSQGRPPTDQPQRGKDVRFTLGINLGEALFGLKRGFNYTYRKECAECNGIGGVDLINCTTCNGQGMQSHTRIEGNTRFTQTITCSDCRGSGGRPSKTCEKCGGGGREEVRKELEVEIPAGVKNGETIVVRGQGTDGKNGGPPGDLHFVVEVDYPNMNTLSEENREILRKLLWPQEEKME